MNIASLKKLPQQITIKKIVQALACALILLLPLQTRWIIEYGNLNGKAWEYGTLSLYAIDVLLIVLLFFVLIYAINTKQRIQPSLALTLVCMLSLIAFFSLAFATNTKVGLFHWLMLTKALVLFVCIPLIPLTSKHYAHAFIASGVIQSIIAIWQFIVQSSPASTLFGMASQDPLIPGAHVIEGAFGRILRASGTLPHPNILAGFLVVGIILALHLLLSSTTKRQQLSYAATLLLMNTALWMTFSRQGWLALATVLGCMGLYTFLTHHSFPRSFVIAALTVIIPFTTLTLTFPDYITTRFQATERLEVKSLEDRSQYLNEAKQLLQEDWITGIGIGNETIRAGQLDSHSAREEVQPVHNIFVLIFTELGIFGLIGFLCFVLLLLGSLNWKNDTQRMWGFVFTALLIIGMFDHYFWTFSVGILFFWSIAGILVSSSTVSSSTR